MPPDQRDASAMLGLARLFDFIETNHALQIAESMVKTGAMMALVRHSEGARQ
jgi:multisubunit Na+/H+ antiporter MnhG subunit